MSDRPDITPLDDLPRIEYGGRPLESFDKATLIGMIGDLITQLDAAHEAVAMAQRQVEGMKAAAGKGFTRGR